jgi:hypothetical protein
VVELIKVFDYAGWGREWKGGNAGGDPAAEGMGRWRLDSGDGALGRWWTREEEDDCLVGLCGLRG